MTEIIIYDDPEIAVPVQVTLDGETVWLTQAQMAELFQVQPQNITIHLRNMYSSGELEKEATCKDFLQVQTEGARRVERSRKFYNLDAIISIGYRVNTKRGVRFRQWATTVLKSHLLRGFSLNRQRLAERGCPFLMDICSRHGSTHAKPQPQSIKSRVPPPHPKRLNSTKIV